MKCKSNIIFVFSLFATVQICLGQSQNMTLYANPPKLSGELFNDCWGYEAANGEEFAIIGARNAIRIYNISDPRNPNSVYYRQDGSNTVWRDFKTYRNYVYGVCDNCNQGLQIICMDSLSTTNFRRDNSKFNASHNIYIDTINARLYAVGANYYLNGGSKNGIICYDISIPSTPVFIGFFNQNVYYHDIWVENHIAYASGEYSGNYIYNMTDVNNVGFITVNGDRTGYHHSSTKHPSSPYLYSAREVPTGLPLTVYKKIGNSLISLSDFQEALLSPVVTNSTPHNPYVHEGKLFVSYYHDGVLVFDLKDPAKPKRMAYYDTYPSNTNYSGYEGCWGVYPFFRSGTIIASDISSGLFVLGLNVKVDFTQDFILTTPGSGLVIKSKWASKKITVDDSGNLITSNPPSPSSEPKIMFSDVKAGGNVVLTSLNGSTFRLVVDNAGVFSTQSVSNTSGTSISTDLIFDDINTGPLIVAPNNNTYRLDINQSSAITSFLKY